MGILHMILESGAASLFDKTQDTFNPEASLSKRRTGSEHI